MASHRTWVRAQDAALAVAVGGIGLAEIWVPFESAVGSGSRVTSSVGVVASAVLLSQRRVLPATSIAVLLVWPVLALLTRQHMQVLFWGQLIVFVFALYSVSRHGSARQAAAGALLTAAILLGADLLIEELRSANEIVFHWSVLTIAFLAGRGLRSSEDRAVASALHAARTEAASKERMTAAVADERARIARELHDVVAHAVSVMVVQAGAAEQVVDDDPELTRSSLRSIRATGTGALAEMRRVVTMLRAPDESDERAPQPGLASLPGLIEQTRHSGLRVELTVEGTPRPLPAGLDLTAYRIVQEALTNVRRHAGASTARAVVRYDAEALEVEVSDDGVGADGALTPGHGIIGMRERAALYGGRLETASPDGHGFTVRAALPVAAPE